MRRDNLIQQALLRAAMAAVRDCAVQMESEAEGLLLALPDLSIDEKLRPLVLGLCSDLKDTASRVTFELALLQAEFSESKVDAAAVVKRLSNLDSTMMTALDGSTDVASQLEKAAERDELNEPAFALAMQAARVMLQTLEKARAATQALAVLPVRLAADGNVMIVQVGAEGGDLTLIGREGSEGGWQFARVTNDQSEALFGEVEVPITAPDLTSLVWVDGWAAGLRLLDRYPWARLYPVYVHPEFVEQLRVAVEERLADVDEASAARAREKWVTLFSRERQGL